MRIDSPFALTARLTGSANVTGSLRVRDRVIATSFTGSISGSATTLKSPYSEPYRTMTSTGNILTTDSFIYASASTSNIVLTLPSPSSIKGRVLRIKKVDSTGYQIVLTSSVNIDSRNQLILSNQNSSVTLHNNSTQYYIH